MPRYLLILCVFVLASMDSVSSGTAQTVRLYTTIGPIDMVLNPTGAPEIQPYVDGFLQYVRAGAYDGVVINRAVKDFVVQMGNYKTVALATNEIPVGGFDNVTPLAHVTVDKDGDGTIDFDTSRFSNTRGQVAFALFRNEVNVRSSSFYVNLIDNSFLDSIGFVPFAAIPDLSVVDAINALDSVDVSNAVGLPNNVAYTNVPVVNGKQLLFISRAVVVPEPATAALICVAGGAFGLKKLRACRAPLACPQREVRSS